MTTDLAAFLLARIAETEEAVWSAVRPGAVLLLGFTNNEGQRVWTTDTLLADCAAKRAIIARWAADDDAAQSAENLRGTFSPAEAGMAGALAEVIDRAILAPERESLFRYLALPYADHPDYRQEWKP